LGNCKIPYTDNKDKESARYGAQMDIKGGNLKNPNGVLAKNVLSSENGRFPANILCSDDILNDLKTHTSGELNCIAKNDFDNSVCYGKFKPCRAVNPKSEGSFYRYFSLDAWFDKKIKELPESIQKTFPYLIVPKPSKAEKGINNNHPTVKPLKLMSYLITLGSRERDLILDPYAGSGTVGEAGRLLDRDVLLFEKDPKYEGIIKERALINVPELSSY